MASIYYDCKAVFAEAVAYGYKPYAEETRQELRHELSCVNHSRKTKARMARLIARIDEFLADRLPLEVETKLRQRQRYYAIKGCIRRNGEYPWTFGAIEEIEALLTLIQAETRFPRITARTIEKYRNLP